MMSVTHSYIENTGYKIQFQSMSFNYNEGKDSRDRTNRQYRLPPPHSSIPIGLIVDNDREDQQARSFERRDLTPSRSDLAPAREQLPSLHQVLSSERSAGNLPPPPSVQTGHFQSRSVQSSSIVHSHSPGSHSKLSHKSERAPSSYASLPPSRGREYESYHTSQPARLPPISQVGIEPPRSRAAEKRSHSRTRDAQDEDSPRSQFGARDTTTSPTQSVSTSSPLVPNSRQEGFPTGPLSQGSAASNQVVDERYLPGKGLCYIFADNSYCPKLIDGQPVNPNWGLTKAGKARKRLAQACIQCREKKIKCQPNLPKCDQCQKSGRECRFDSAPRGRSSSYE